MSGPNMSLLSLTARSLSLSAPAHNAVSMEIWERFIEQSKPLPAEYFNRFAGLTLEKVAHNVVDLPPRVRRGFSSGIYAIPSLVSCAKRKVHRRDSRGR